MKAFFSRLHLGSTREKEKLQSSPSEPSLKPLPQINEDHLIPESPTPTPTPPPPDPDSAVHKKVAFISPPLTPVQPVVVVPPDPAPVSPTAPPLKTSVSRFQDTHAGRGSTSSAGASSSKTNLASSSKASVKATSTRTASPYLHKQDAVSAQSLRSGTPYSQMSNNTSGSRILAATSWSQVTEEDLVTNLGSRERTRQEVLFEIISSEERYVSELAKMKDTFIDPLLHPYSSTPVSPLSSTPNLDYEYYRTESPVESTDQLPPIAARFMSPTPSLRPPESSSRQKDHIDAESMDTDEEEDNYQPPAKRFGSPKPPAKNTSQAAKHNHPRSPYRSTVTKNVGKNGTTVPFPSRSHHSLPPPPRSQQLSASTHSLGRQSVIIERERERNYSQGQSSLADRKGDSRPGMLRKFNRKNDNKGVLGDSVAPHQLPEDLRICLEVIDSGVFDGHKRLSEALRKRYEDQFPLVRSLADVFVSNSDIFQGYAKYVLHLERALEQVDNALSNASTKKPKNQDVAEWQKVCRVIKRLEESASEKGETGLAISLSKPFQRLLKYPLLFQNLLFHTDPSTFEYESTLQMVAEVETIVRSIEDEKIQKEERDKTRDVFARIEGIDKVRQVAAPKPSRVLVEERQYNAGPSSPSSGLSKPASPPPVATNGKGVKGKSSFRRLSDVLNTGKKDLWLVVFNDVVLLCQKTGTTSLPLVAATNSRTNSLPELQGRSKYASTGRRNSQTKPRNLYKFIKIETWAIGDVVQPREGVVSMEDVARSRAQMNTQPRIVPLPPDDEDEDGGADSDDSDRKSKMSFSYWGADKITVQKPVVKPRAGLTVRRGGHGPAYARESSANAKFGTRLVSNESSSSPRPASRRTTNTPTVRRNGYSEDGHNSAKATVTKPGWNTSTRTPTATPVSKRSRNISQTSATARTTGASAVPAKVLASPAPSEDSGVGLYRQMMANDPNLNQLKT
ncbi:hypothetical protein D9758_003223 [Tetrapyrgos nigripes]|uniref:DH domain-containing protein n=1 Tax=Tetrapyrgos nigripes TaxID=182062 RepID=A0A8H5LQE9_9AGAR|nr:hypothetical protein D9758_003223 [Tetrapyrgos nigripes]